MAEIRPEEPVNQWHQDAEGDQKRPYFHEVPEPLPRDEPHLEQEDAERAPKQHPLALEEIVERLKGVLIHEERGDEADRHQPGHQHDRLPGDDLVQGFVELRFTGVPAAGGHGRGALAGRERRPQDEGDRDPRAFQNGHKRRQKTVRGVMRLLHERVGDRIGDGGGAPVVGGDAGRIGDRHAPQIAQDHERGERGDAAEKQRGERRLPDGGHAMRLVFVREFVASDESDRHQQKDRDREIELLRNLDAAVDPRADDAQDEAERDRRQQVSLERLEDPGDLLGIEDGQREKRQACHARLAVKMRRNRIPTKWA